MAADSAQERSLPATQQRLDKARADGQAVRSTELSTTLVLGGGALALWWFGAAMAERFQALLARGLRLDAQAAFEVSAMGQRLHELALEALWIALPLLATLVFAAVVAPMLIGGWMFSMKAVQFKAARMDPLAGLARLFSRRGAFEMVKSLLKVIVLSAALAWLFHHFQGEFMQLASNEARGMLPAAAHALQLAFLTLAGVMGLIACGDVPFQLWRHHSELRMTREEVKEEHRESDGDPLVRSQIRQRQREMARRRMMSEVPKADVVVTNPTHYAVALQYREDGMRAPVVLAKGRGLVALRIREIAAAHGVPRLEAPPLARALHEHADIGGEVPAALYGAVAQVLAWVYQLRQGGKTVVVEPTVDTLAVPPELDPATRATAGGARAADATAGGAA